MGTTLKLPFMTLALTTGRLSADDDGFSSSLKGYRRVRREVDAPPNFFSTTEGDVEESRRKLRNLYISLFCEPIEPPAEAPAAAPRPRAPRARQQRRTRQRAPTSADDPEPSAGKSLAPTDVPLREPDERTKKFLDYLIRRALETWDD